MKTTTVITGKAGSGKTQRATQLAKAFDPSEVCFITGMERSDEDPFLFQKCTGKTKLVVIDEVSSIFQLKKFIEMSRGYIIVNRQGKQPFNISPSFILVCHGGINIREVITLGTSLPRRISIINCVSS